MEVVLLNVCLIVRRRGKLFYFSEAASGRDFSLRVAGNEVVSACVMLGHKRRASTHRHPTSTPQARLAAANSN